MKTALITIKTEPKIKQKAQKIATNLGLSLSSIINAQLHQLIKTETVLFGNIDKAEEPNDYLKKILKKSETERAKGDYHSFNNSKDAIKFLDTIIDSK